MSEITPSNAAVVRKAADIILERGLAQHTFEDKEHRVCCWGVLGIALCSSPQSCFYTELYRAIEKVILREYPDTNPIFTITRWNDKPGRTADEVAHILKLTAEELEIAARH